MLVKFLQPYEVYASGEVAKIEEFLAGKLIQLGYAEAVKGK